MISVILGSHYYADVCASVDLSNKLVLISLLMIKNCGILWLKAKPNPWLSPVATRMGPQ